LKDNYNICGKVICIGAVGGKLVDGTLVKENKK